MIRIAFVMLAACGRIGFDSRGGDAATTIGGDVMIDVPSGPPNAVFATSALFDGTFGGVAEADAMCSAAAINGGLPGSFVSYVSGAPLTRVNGSRGWARVSDGAPYADLPTDFVQGQILAPLDSDEFGASLGMLPFVWTGILGGLTGDNCTDWTSTTGSGITGDLRSGSIDFSSFDDQPCGQSERVLCLGIGRDVPVHITATTGRFAFVSSETWAPNGVADADSVCQAEATAAGLPGTYLAALPTTTTTTASRFDLGGAPWVRTDGAAIASSARGLFEDAQLVNFLNRHADGSVDAFDDNWWTGEPEQVPTANCQDWTVSQDPAVGANGVPNHTLHVLAYATAREASCTELHSLMCLQE